MSSVGRFGRRCFNSRSREGGDYTLGSMFRSPPCFNSRSREGSDRSVQWRHLGSRRFNSRSREGSDNLWLSALQM